MSVPAAFIGIILIWSTTPLAIKWSAAGPGFMFGVTSRMLLGTLVCLLVLGIARGQLPWHRTARHTYVAAGLGIYGAMLSVYWGSQYIPSGLIAVVFGLTPLITGVMAALWLQEQSLGFFRLAGILLGMVGLFVIFGAGVDFGGHAAQGVAAVLLSVLLHSASAVWVKRIGAAVPALSVTTGGLMVAAPLYVLTWWFLDGNWPKDFPVRAIWSIVYLGIIGSVVGFMLYFYVLGQVAASRVALITLITPVTALLLGNLLNAEYIRPAIWIGTVFILLGMSIYQWGRQMVYGLVGKT